MSDSETKCIVVEDVVPHPPAIVWKALTTSALIAKWLIDNDFELAIGRTFQFKSRPMGDWNGVVDCEVLAVEPERRLVYSWKGGTPPNELDTIVMWTLAATEAGTRLRMEHSGFRLPQNQMAYAAMSPGWGGIVKRIGEVCGGLAA